MITLTLKQQQFCKYYIENKGNATKAYMKAFSTKKYDTARVNASKLLTNTNIGNKIYSIMKDVGYNDIYADMELMKLMRQDKNLPLKLRALAEYNKLRKRYDNPPDTQCGAGTVIYLPMKNNKEKDNIVVSWMKEDATSEKQI